MRAPAIAVAVAVLVAAPAAIVTAAVFATPDVAAWQADCSTWSTTRFVLTATCRDDAGSDHTSSLNLGCGEPPAILVTGGRLTCARPTEEPVAGTWADRCVGGHVVNDAGAPRLVAFCAADDGAYLMPEFLSLGDCAEPASVTLADGELACAAAAQVANSEP